MKNTLEEIEAFLKSNPANSVDIFDYENQNKKFYKKLSYADLQREGFSFKDLISQLHYTYTSNVLGVQKFKPNGTSNRKVDFVIRINNSTQNKMPEEVVHETAQGVSESQPTVTPPVSSSNYYPQNHNNMNTPGGMSAPMGMSMPEVVRLNVVEAKYESLKERYDDLKEKYNKQEKKVDDLDSENRKLKGVIEIADKVKEVALEKEKLNKKPIIDPDIIKSAFGMLGQYLPNNPSAPVGMAAPDITEGLSENKKAFVHLIKSDNISDEFANQLSFLTVAMMRVAPFKTELEELIKKHNIKELIQ
ncbi:MULTISPECIES: hypothetical protein [unclassified Tenacibaculum]|uniref:hypothetical protein n=1 Tax=unclassified Tenacibaculum TaxID=2635139 RepID=UPI001F2F9602|nr:MULTISPECIES: hypothetical protein [unclassified Tenacibaculum]MCF2875426.1 hypothetical protein [Tenacibaculum sp. Cn5-1]MCF2935502.1 hypothetical protein [Tenacibaculum sp. Cn5-34]MCG7512062.1 hypothetical protein [Tenacibaculum sp. Cn5-46]